MARNNASPTTPSHDLVSFARELASAARDITLKNFARPGRVDNKSDDGRYDPVTEADQAAERAMRSIIGARFPDHGIHGEEFGQKVGAGPYAWSLDPIDGTRSYICGLPTWVTLIALLEDKRPVLGVIDAPRLGELYVGAPDEAFLETADSRLKLQTSGCANLAEARLSTTDPYLFGGAAADAFGRLASAVRTTRFGHDGYAYARLAAGTLDLVVECGLKPHDYDALIPVVRGAGGVFGDWSGGTDFRAGNVIAAATPRLYEMAVSIIRGAR
jgi:myo-inositol-1(or 4)-monophosphatase